MSAELKIALSAETQLRQIYERRAAELTIRRIDAEQELARVIASVEGMTAKHDMQLRLLADDVTRLTRCQDTLARIVGILGKDDECLPGCGFEEACTLCVIRHELEAPR